MEFDRFHQFGTLLLHDAFVLSYSGYVTEDILEAVGSTLRARLADHTASPRQIRNVFSIFVELMQNVIRYGTEGPSPPVCSAIESPLVWSWFARTVHAWIFYQEIISAKKAQQKCAGGLSF